MLDSTPFLHFSHILVFGVTSEALVVIQRDLPAVLTKALFSGMWARSLGPCEIDGLLVAPSKAYNLLTNHLIDYWLIA